MRFVILAITVVCMNIGCNRNHETAPASQVESPPLRIVYLKKANDDVVSHCSCGDGRVTFPPQMDCPWCGCGWLFTCITCRKAFTFAEAVEIETTWEEIAQEDIRNKWNDEPSAEDVAAWIAAMKEMLADVRPGGRYVILDGAVLPVDAAVVAFDGWHAHHDLESLPHVDALADKSVIEERLGNREYWTVNALPNPD
jgi:hypothetical protein